MLSIEKMINAKKNRNFTVRLIYPSYLFPCIYSFCILLYAIIAHIGDSDQFLILLCILWLISLFTVRYRRGVLKDDFFQHDKKRIFKLNFVEHTFSFGYENGILINIPYNSIIDYKIVKESLFIQAGQGIYQVNLDIFSDEEISEITELLSSLEHIKKGKGFRFHLNRTLK